MKKIYLAIPYRGYEEASFKLANATAAAIMTAGYLVFSPISHSHVIAATHGLPDNWEFWSAMDKSFIDWADEVWVIGIGEDPAGSVAKSNGVQDEISYAASLGKPVKFIQYGDGRIEYLGPDSDSD